MLTDKELKKKFKIVASNDPDKYYATKALREQGFHRMQCSKCDITYWTTHKSQATCGDASCIGKVNIFDNPPANKKLGFAEVWFDFKKFFEARGYRAVPRYPVIARWNPTIDFTNSSISAFQPYVISGESEPPASKLVIPQFCLRFGDVDNVGVTGSHCTGFVMIGQHMFVSTQEWDQYSAFMDIYEYITQEVGVDKAELTLHEDSWAGGGNYGPCMEFFSRGVELFNQVYMMFEHATPKDKELKIRVLDMGLGMERVAWYTQGSPTIYDAAFPQVIKILKTRINADFDTELYNRFAPFATKLDFDESSNVEAAWEEISKSLNLPAKDLKERILPLTALYSIAEHSRALLFAISDGGLPSNVGGYYNLRVIFRRAMDYIAMYNWSINIADVCEWHANELKPVFPDLSASMPSVRKIIGVEAEKYLSSRQRGEEVIDHLLNAGKELDTSKLVMLYDSQGITPEQVKARALRRGIKISVPDNFYNLVSDRHLQAEQKTQTRKERNLDISGLLATKALYYDSFDYVNFEARVERIIDGKYVVLDKTAFYPTSGGQVHDKGTINGEEVAEVFRQSSVIIHELKKKPGFKAGDAVAGMVDFETRLQLAQHHTAAHIINGCARTILGNHVWQAGAAKSLTKARLDITHFEALNSKELSAIEDMANEVIRRNIPVIKSFMPRALAEAKYGFVLYQGGAVPGREIRVVNIEGLDVEACGGTHLNMTGEAGSVKLLKSSKLQDGMVRLEFVAGKAALNAIISEASILDETKKALGVDKNLVLARAQELFSKWKLARKIIKSKSYEMFDPNLFELSSSEEYEGNDILERLAGILQTQPEHVPKTLERFNTDLSACKKLLYRAQDPNKKT